MILSAGRPSEPKGRDLVVATRQSSSGPVGLGDRGARVPGHGTRFRPTWRGRRLLRGLPSPDRPTSRRDAGRRRGILDIPQSRRRDVGGIDATV